MKRPGILLTIILTLPYTALALPSLIETPQLIASLPGSCDPAFTPDGKSLFFSAGEEGKHNIYSMLVAGGNPDVFITEGDNLSPDVFPDGSFMVWACDRQGNFDIWKMSLGDKKQLQLTSDPADELSPKISPIMWEYGYEEAQETGKSENFYKILLLKETGGRYDLCTINSDSTRYTPFTFCGQTLNAEIFEEEFGYTTYNCPDDAYQTYSTINDGDWFYGGLSIIGSIVGPSGTETARLDYTWGWDKPKFIQVKMQAVRLSVSPNSTQIAYVDQSGDLYIYDLYADDVVKVAGGVDPSSNIAWAPDGKALAYSKGGKIFLQKLNNPASEVWNMFEFNNFSPNQLEKIAENGFIATGQTRNLFHNIYHYEYMADLGDWYETPNFITSDAVLEVFHLYFDYLLRTIEEKSLYDKLMTMTTALVSSANERLAEADNSAEKTRWEFIRDYFTVAYALLNPDMPASYSPGVTQELENIKNLSGDSLFFPDKEPAFSFAVFKPRGHYTTSPKLTDYFLAMMWLSQGSFLADNGNPQSRDEETLTSLYISSLMQDKTVMGLWQDIYDIQSLFVGRADDFGPDLYTNLLADIYGSTEDFSKFADPEKLEIFRQEIAKLPPPKIGADLRPAFKLFPQSYTPDTNIMQNLVFPQVGDTSNPRLLPCSAEVMSALGSQRAMYYLTEVFGFDRYVNYKSQLEKMVAEFKGYGDDFYSANIYNRWLYSIKLLFDAETPIQHFMETPAWQDKLLTTGLATWTELRHDTILYNEPSGDWGSGGGPDEFPVIPEVVGYVEPHSQLYQALQKTVVELHDQLLDRHLWFGDYRQGDEFSGFKTLDETYQTILTTLDYLNSINEKEFAGKELSAEERKFIKRFGAYLENITLNLINYDKEVGSDDEMKIDNQRVALVADVASGSAPGIPPKFLLEGVGDPSTMVAVVNLAGKQQLCTGGVYLHYELENDKPINDTEWRALLDSSNAPEPGPWMDSYLVYPQVKVLAEALNLRALPDIESAKVGTVKKDEWVYSLGREEEQRYQDPSGENYTYYWLKVKSKAGTVGWLCYMRVNWGEKPEFYAQLSSSPLLDYSQ